MRPAKPDCPGRGLLMVFSRYHATIDREPRDVLALLRQAEPLSGVVVNKSAADIAGEARTKGDCKHGEYSTGHAESVS